jgi:hypothetical protein
VKEHLFRFNTGIKFLEDQTADYRKLSSPLGLEPTRKEYLDFVDKIVEKLGIKSEDIARKLKILSYDDIANMYHRCLNDIISCSDEILKLYVKEKENFHKGIRESMNEKEFETALKKKNTLFERFQTEENEYELDEFYQSILIYNSPEEYLKTNTINIFIELFRPVERIQEKQVAKKIYNYFFPKEEDVFSNQRLAILKDDIPFSLEKFLTPRIFYISAHGDSCPIYKYKDIPRLNIKQEIIKFNRKSRDKKKKGPFVSYKNVMFIANQPIGRLSLIYLIKVFIDLFTEEHREIILNAILGARNQKEIQIIQQFFDIYVYKHLFKDVYTSKDTFEDSFENQIRQFESRTELKHIYPETEETSKEYLNFVKYDYIRPPPDTVFHFKNVDTNENLTGIFELNLQNGDTLTKLSKSLNFIQSDIDMNMGLSAEKIFSADSIPEDLEEVVKYNKAIKSTGKTNFTHGEVLNLILENADIQENDYLVIFTNQCRGITSFSGKGENFLNTINYFKHSKIQTDSIRKFRRASLQRSHSVRPPRSELLGSKKRKKHKRKYSVKKKKKRN